MEPKENEATEKSLNPLPIKKVGLIVNPIAGMGGIVGLKGTDGKEILKEAISRGAKPIASKRAEAFLLEIAKFKPNIELLVGMGEMGEEQAKRCKYNHKSVGEKKKVTNSEDTFMTAKKIIAEGVDLLVFCGGDGTARDILRATGRSIPIIGVPTGVKMHSAVFAITPLAAASLLINYLWNYLPIRETEVMDVDEEAFRAGHVSAKLYGYVLTPYEPHLIQSSKMASVITENEVRNLAAIAVYIIESMTPKTFYIIGPGTTTRTIVDLLDEEKTLLGVDILCDKKIVAKDVSEKEIFEIINDKKARIIVTPIGGQGFIFGRGNQQISPKVIRKVGIDNIIIIATETKLKGLRCLRVDTGDSKLDAELGKYKTKVISDYKNERSIKVE